MRPKIQNRSSKGDPTLEELPVACASESAAVEFLEKQRFGDCPYCPKCASVDVYKMLKARSDERQANFRWRCRDCKEQFTVRTGTVFEDSRIPLHKWCYAFWRASTSKKGVSALEMKRQLRLSYKSALFLMHRIRWAMQEHTPELLTGTVEVDETYVGGKPRYKGNSKRGRGTDKTPVVALVQRQGEVRVRKVSKLTSRALKTVILDHVGQTARIITDENSAYTGIGASYAGGHETINHGAGEYARGDVTTNTVEGFFGIVKRGLYGIYHAVSDEHLPRYLSEYEFRWNHRELEDGPRTVKAIQGAVGKRLLYKPIP